MDIFQHWFPSGSYPEFTGGEQTVSLTCACILWGSSRPPECSLTPSWSGYRFPCLNCRDVVGWAEPSRAP